MRRIFSILLLLGFTAGEMSCGGYPTVVHALSEATVFQHWRSADGEPVSEMDIQNGVYGRNQIHFTVEIPNSKSPAAQSFRGSFVCRQPVSIHGEGSSGYLSVEDESYLDTLVSCEWGNCYNATDDLCHPFQIAPGFYTYEMVTGTRMEVCQNGQCRTYDSGR